MNPYDFVPIDLTSEPKRRPPTQHHKFSGISGRIEGTITAETPLLIRDSKQEIQIQFLTNRDGKYIIPGSSLKGMIRNLVETLGPGCFKLFDAQYREHSWPTNVDYYNKLPRRFQECRNPKNLCIACRMFGTLVGNYAGNVNLDDAVCIEPVNHDPVILPPLYKPRPYHEAWYLSTDKQEIAGRKFYFHQSPPYYFKRLAPRRRHDPREVKVIPLGEGSQFTFSLNFENLNCEDEFPLLLYALNLQADAMRHKIGYAKSAGFGTIRIDLTKLVEVDYANRYLNQEGTQTREGQSLQDYLQTQTTPIINDTSDTLVALRRIWKWPADEPPVGYGYPTRDWFNDNPNASIAESWDAPRQF